MTTIHFHVPGEPVAKGRARAFLRHGHIAHYTPEKTANFESRVALACQQAMQAQGVKPIDGAVELEIDAVFPIPASWPKGKRMMASTSMVYHTGRKDADNIAKACADGMNRVAFEDDKQVARLIVTKRYGDADIIGCHVTVRALHQ